MIATIRLTDRHPSRTLAFRTKQIARRVNPAPRENKETEA